MPARRISCAFLAMLAICLLFAACGGDSEPRSEGKPFRPEVSLTVVGGTARTDKPELVLLAETRSGDANIRSAKVTLPAAFLIDQTALGNLCSERELEADRCAGRQRMGFARVVSPLYGTLEGPVYAVSGSGGLPRLAYVLGGSTDLLLRGRIEIVGARIQAGIEDVPDAPLKTFELRIDGGERGYLVLSRDICRRAATAVATFASQDGQGFERQLPLKAACG